MASLETSAKLPVVDPEFTLVDSFPLGQNIVDIIGTHGSDSKEARLAVRGLRNGFRALVGSDKEEDKDTAADINSCFIEQSLGHNKDEFPEGFRQLRVANWLARATNSQIIEFSGWNVEDHKANQKKLNALTPKLIDETIDSAERMVKLGYLPKSVLTAFKQTIKIIGPIKMMDSFEAGILHADGYFSDGGFELGLSNQLLTWGSLHRRSNLYRTTFHEYVHGVGFVQDKGFFDGIATRNKAGLRLLEEPYTAHTAQVAIDKDPMPQTINPADRLDTSEGSYPEEREWLHLMTAMGRKPITAAQLSEAFFAAKAGSVTVRKDLERRLMTNAQNYFPSLGENALFRLAESYEKVCSRRRERLVSRWVRSMWDSLGCEVDYIRATNNQDSTNKIKTQHPYTKVAERQTTKSTRDA